MSYYQQRVQHGMERGLSRRAAAGHPAKGEPTAHDLAVVDKLGSASPIGNLRQAVIAHLRAALPDSQMYNPAVSRPRLEEQIRHMRSKKLLAQMYHMTRAQWAAQATAAHVTGQDKSPFYYHP